MAEPTIAKLVNPEKGKREPSDPDYAMECSNYIMESKSWLPAKENREGNGQRVNSLILQHCQPTLELKISEQTEWILVRDSRDMTSLLKLIRNIIHNQDELKHAVMSVVECDLELMLGFQ